MKVCNRALEWNSKEGRRTRGGSQGETVRRRIDCGEECVAKRESLMDPLVGCRSNVHSGVSEELHST